MPSKLRLASEKPTVNGKHLGRKHTPWVDVGDDDDRRRKTPNRVTTNTHDSSPRKHKRARHSFSNGLENSAGPSNPKSAAIQEQRRQLPIAKGKDALIQEIRDNDVTVLLGETGSGKTTQVPQYLLESGIAGTGIIAVTQPRKVAATSLAARVAAEQSTSVGKLVGYSVRFEERTSEETRIKYMTDGMIVRELLGDPLLSRYSVVIVDEAHERTLRTDLLIANLKTIQKQRNGDSGKGKGNANPLKIVVMSATLDAEKFSKFYHNAKILYVKGRQHPVKIYHSAEGQPDYVDAAMRTFFQIHTDQPPGDVLIFLPGQEDIESLEKSIQLFANRLPKDKMEVLVTPMYAAQAPGQNIKAFISAPPNTRKCILATNIAETSITIPGVKYVVDTGKCKEKRYLAREGGGGFDTLMTKDITRSSAMQRAGRAGREGMGVCFRLYTEEAFNGMKISSEPEIMRCSLSSSVLQLKCLGQDLEDLDLMDSPDRESIFSALKSLWLLGAINDRKELTRVGRQMASFPLEPAHARAVLAAKDYACVREVLDIVSVLSASGVLFVDVSGERESAAEARAVFRHPLGDHLTILGAVRAYEEVVAAEEGDGEGKGKGKGKGKSARREWCKKHYLNERTLVEARDIRAQLRETCGKVGLDWRVSCGEDQDRVLKALGHGLAQNSAFLQPDGSYKQTMGQSIVKIHPGSTLCDKKVPAIVYDELTYTNQIYARGVSSMPKSFFATLGSLNQRRA